MNLAKARVRNYRSAKDTGWININENVTTFIGKNESGKTSILKAISSFSTQNGYKKSVLTNTADTTVENESIPIISVVLEVEKNDHNLLQRISDDGKITATKYFDGSKEVHNLEEFRGDKDYLQEVREYIKGEIKEVSKTIEKVKRDSDRSTKKTIENKIRPELEDIISYEIDDTGSLEGKLKSVRDSINGLDLDNEKHAHNNKSLHKEIYQYRRLVLKSDPTSPQLKLYDLFPEFVYVNDIQPISDSVCKGSDQDRDTVHHERIRNIISEGGERFRNMGRSQALRQLEYANRKIERQMNHYWTQKSIEVTIHHDKCDDDDCFNIIITDGKISTDRNETESVRRDPLRPSQRSDGFQWFFSFFIRYMSDSEVHGIDNRVFLFDDPALTLHPEGKRNWVETVENIGDSAQVLYTSHSPFLISKDHPSRIRIVEDLMEDRTTVTDQFHEAGGLAMEPVRAALGIGLGDSPFISKRKLVVEGVVDHYVILGIMNYYAEFDEDILKKDEVTTMPAGGAQKIPDAAKWLATEEISYGILLDDDEEGRDVKDRIKNEYHLVDEERIVMLGDGEHEETVIEDVFKTEFYIDCVNSVYEEEISEFEEIEVITSDGDCEIDGREYDTEKITKIVQGIFDDRGIGDLDKEAVGREIKSRLDNNQNVAEEDIDGFKPVLGRLRGIIR